MAKQVELKCPLSTGYGGWGGGCVCMGVVGWWVGGFKRHARGVFVDYFSCWSLYASSMRVSVINTIRNMACFQIFLQFLVNMWQKTGALQELACQTNANVKYAAPYNSVTCG